MRVGLLRVLTHRSSSRLLCRRLPYSTDMSGSELTSLTQSVSEQSTLLKTLREQNAAQSLIDDAHKKLGDLKKKLGQLTASAKDKDKTDAKKKERLLLKTAKGTRDFGPAEAACRSYIESTIRDVFTSFGGTGLDTPVFERKDILAGKYGEDAKLIFDLADQGGEQLALRYDHTVCICGFRARNNRHC